MAMRQTIFLILVAVLLSESPKASAGVESIEVNLEYVGQKAEARSRKPFRSPRADLPEVLRADQLGYDKYREIRFRRDQALWAAEKLPFRVEFFHPGYLYEEPVHINEFSFNYVQPVRFVQDFFDYGNLQIKNQIPADTGYAGFRILYPLNQPGQMDELGAFLGASYYRLLGKGQHYGESARGLALDCGESGRPEEFPIFTDWWLGKPRPDDTSVILFAELDSVSCTGAYEFRIHPGETTTVDIDAILYMRTPDLVHAVDSHKLPLISVGMAPLTSMFWFGKNSERKFDDYRPEVHDSDGLLMKMDSGEVLWRPLNNASVLRHQRFATRDIRGFGLMQRARDFAAYEDLFNPYQTVPSVWVEPKGRWGEGALNLVELSTGYEGMDNVVAYWDPVKKPEPMLPFRFSYTQYWTHEMDHRVSPNHVVATRIGPDSRNPRWRQFVIDFEGPKFSALPEGVAPEAIASCSTNGAIVENQVFKMPAPGEWRAIIKLEPKTGNTEPVDLRCTMKHGDEPLSETWTYLWSPP
jgi:glucans biosynthesis protein